MRDNNKGVVLVIALWVLLVLSLIAWGLSRRSSMEVSLLEVYRGKLRSYAAARAGINTMLDMMQRSPSSQDTLYSTGILFDQTKSPEDIFSHIDTGQNSYAIIQWPAHDYNTTNNPQLEYGIRDEDGKININAINSTNYQILSALLQIQGLSQGDGDKLAMAIVGYTGGQASSNNSFLNLNDESPLKPKNKHYENILELLEVSGMTKDIFDKIKDDITVYGDVQNGLWINTDTANNDVIMAVVNAAARLNPAIGNPTSFINEAYLARDGADGVSFTSDDGVSGITDPNWPAPALQEGTPSNYYRIRSVGVDGTSGTRTVLEAVVQRPQGGQANIIAWQRD